MSSTVQALVVVGALAAGAGGGAAVAPLRRRRAHKLVRAAGGAPRPQQITVTHDFWDEQQDRVYRRGETVTASDPVLKRHADRFHIE